MIDLMQGLDVLNSLPDSDKYALYEAALLTLVDADHVDQMTQRTGMSVDGLGRLRDTLISCLPPLEDAQLETV